MKSPFIAGTMTDLRARLEAAVGTAYRVENELGQGGMAVVLLARDIRHDQSLAIKVVRPELAASLGAERFLREIQIATQLHHSDPTQTSRSGPEDSRLTRSP